MCGDLEATADMSDDTTPPQQPIGDPEFTAENVDRFLKEKWLSMSCPRCGVNQWAVDLPRKTIVNFPVSVPPLFSTTAGHVMPYYMLLCLNCGHPEFFMRSVFIEWCRAQPGLPS